MVNISTSLGTLEQMTQPNSVKIEYMGTKLAPLRLRLVMIILIIIITITTAFL